MTVANIVGSVVSEPAELSIVPAGTAATHATVGGGYSGGSVLTISNLVTYTGSANALGWHVLIPDGWTFVGNTGQVGETKPTAGQTGALEWAWTVVPPSPVAFSYTVNVPVGTTGEQSLAAFVSLRQTGPGFQLLVKPDPLKISELTNHAADTDRDNRINLVELTRVIALYNTRNGNVRTGAYRLAATVTEDGFDADPARTGETSLTLYHSADTSRDGRFSLVELTRVIELYNYRVGTNRTGQYRLQQGTEDGFGLGPP